MSRPADRLAASLALLALLLPAGCRAPAPEPEDSSPPFVFRSLDLRQQDRQGRPAWRLRSPETRYDLRRRLAQTMNPRGEIFADGQPLYRLAARRGTVINDGEAILLEGDIRLDRLGDKPLQIRALRARWTPARNRLDIDRRPEAFDGQNRLTSRRARYRFDEGRLELRGEPRLQHWARRFDPRQALPAGPPETVLVLRTVDWVPASGELTTTGQVRALRRPDGRAPDKPAQILTASTLNGNTLQQRYTLGAPVRFEDPFDGTSLSTGSVQLDLAARRASTAAAFEGRRGAQEARGTGLVVDGGRQEVTIASGCRLQRPGESLRADRCLWNWSTSAVEADGPLELRRAGNDQITRGSRLRGSLGDDGAIEITAPAGGRVVSRFRPRARPSGKAR